MELDQVRKIKPIPWEKGHGMGWVVVEKADFDRNDGGPLKVIRQIKQLATDVGGMKMLKALVGALAD